MRRQDRREGFSLYEHYKMDLSWVGNYKEELRRLRNTGFGGSIAYIEKAKLLQDLEKIIDETEEKYPEFKV